MAIYVQYGSSDGIEYGRPLVVIRVTGKYSPDIIDDMKRRGLESYAALLEMHLQADTIAANMVSHIDGDEAAETPEATA